jgi:hypothetical protein
MTTDHLRRGNRRRQQNTAVASAEDYYKSLYNNFGSVHLQLLLCKIQGYQPDVNLSKKITEKLGLTNASVSVIGRNLFFIYKDAPNIDPERGPQHGQCPGNRKPFSSHNPDLGFNLNLNF